MTPASASQDHLFHLQAPENEKHAIPIAKKQRILNMYSPFYIAINSGNCFFVCDFREITLCRAEGNYTSISLINNQKLISSKNLKMIEDLLPGDYFLRIHHSYLVNLAHVEKMYLGNEDKLVLRNGQKLPVSRRRKKELLERVALL